MGISSKIFQDTMLLSTHWLSIQMEFWCQEVKYSLPLFMFQTCPAKISVVYKHCCILSFTFVPLFFLIPSLTYRCCICPWLSFFTPADNGTIHMWDWRTGYNFQRIHAAVQPGSLDSESGIFACVFDQSESRLITAEADKTIKVYKEDDTAVSYWFIINSHYSIYY